jgi:hypothetical protein
MEKLISPLEASELTGIPLSSLRQLAISGKISYVCITPKKTHRKYLLSSIEAYIRENTHHAETERATSKPPKLIASQLPGREASSPGSLAGFPILQSMGLEEKRAKHRAAMAERANSEQSKPKPK